VGVIKPAYQKYLPLILVVLLGFALYLFSGRARRATEARANKSHDK
jgi:hypothetical protein